MRNLAGELKQVFESLRAERDRLLPLAKLGRWCLTESRAEFTDVDGFELEERALDLGLLAKIEVSESCGDNCMCEDFPAMCYRETEVAKLPEMA